MTVGSPPSATEPVIPAVETAAPPQLILATDLDGTFLAGSAEQRHRLYRLIDQHPGIQLIFITGRGLEAVMPLLSDPSIPRPDYIVCDVGATVVDGHTLQPLQPLQSMIEAHWPGEHVVAAAMRPYTALQRQDVPQERRCSYFCDPKTLAPLRAQIEQTAR